MERYTGLIQGEKILGHILGPLGHSAGLPTLQTSPSKAHFLAPPAVDTNTLRKIPSPSPKLSAGLSVSLRPLKIKNRQAFHFKGLAMDHCMEADRDTGNLTVNKREILQDYNLPQPEERVPKLSALMELGNPIGLHLLIHKGGSTRCPRHPSNCSLEAGP